MKADNLRDLLVHEIQDLHSVESQIIDALPDMIQKTGDAELKKALQEHLEQTRQHRERIEDVARSLETEARGEKCAGMAGILKEGDDTVNKVAKDEQARDAAIIASAQRVEHYEMAAYGTARTYARMLGKDDVVRSLEENLDQEKEADRKLTAIAEDHVNRRAMAAQVGD